jgi:hypothetical protein
MLKTVLCRGVRAPTQQQRYRDPLRLLNGLIDNRARRGRGGNARG